MTPTNGDPSGGEQIDRAAHEAIRLAHLALERFPDLVRRHKFIAGGAAISSSLIVLAGVAIARRMRAGETPEEAVAAVTEEEVQGLHVVEPEPEAVAEAPAEVDIEEAAGNGETEGAPTPVLARRMNGA
jgi:hypothetical protein